MITAEPPKIEPVVDYSDYLSPIKQYVQQAEIQRINDLIVQVSQKVGYEIDKDELTRALNYDRNQFKKGFIAGKQSAGNTLNIAITKLRETIDYLESEVISGE